MKFYKNFVSKYITLLIVGTLAFSVVGTGVLYYVNNYYLRETDAGDVKVINITKNVQKKLQNKVVSIPGDATMLQSSHDGRYLSYIKNGVLDMTDLTTGSNYTVSDSNSMNIETYKWIYDRDRMLVIGRYGGKSAGYYLKMYYYDMKDKHLTEVEDNDGKEVRIPLSGKTDKVTGIDASTATNLTYIKVTDSAGDSKVWLSNIMAQTKQLSELKTRKISSILSLKQQNELFYQSGETGRLYRYGKSSVSIYDSNDLYPLGTDSEDNAYFAAVKDNHVTMIYYGDPTGKDGQSYQDIHVNGDFAPANVYVTNQGKVYGDVKSSSEIVDLKTGKKTAYKGRLVALFDGGMLSEENGQIYTEVLG